MADSKKYNGSTWEHSLRKLGTAADTITTLPVDIYADGNNATVGISGNTAQNGTPTPDNPIMPQGTGERTAQLFDLNATDTTNGYVNGAYLLSDGSESENPPYRISEYIEIQGGTAYTLVYGNSLNNPSLCFYDSSKQYISGQKYGSNRTVTVTSPSNAKYIRISYTYTVRESVMLNLGSTALPYEPWGIKIPISSASTTTPVYLGEVETTRVIKKLIFDGTEDWTQSSTDVTYNRYKISISGMKVYGTRLTPLYCTHYQNVSDGRAISNVPNNSIYTGSGIDTYIKDTTFSSIIDFKSYLASQYTNGTPVTVWYVLATPETGIVNEPLMKIGNYADTVSGITVPTITGKDTFDVETTLKPSEASLSYTGWHDAEVKEWDGSQWNE